MLWLEAPATWLGLLATAYNKAVFRAYFRAIPLRAVLRQTSAHSRKNFRLSVTFLSSSRCLLVEPWRLRLNLGGGRRISAAKAFLYPLIAGNIIP